MLLRILVVLLTITLLNPVQAQESDEEVWNWAWDRSTGELFAYSENGDVNHIFSDIDNWLDPFWRIDQSQAVGLLRTIDESGLYLIDSSSVQPFIGDDHVQEVFNLLSADNWFRYLSYEYPFLLLTTVQSVSHEENKHPVLMLNLDTYELTRLSDNITETIRFMADREHLRFVIRTLERGEETITLIERSLLTGVERILYRIEGGWLSVQADSIGEQWLFEVVRGDLIQYRLFSVGNQSDELIYASDPSEPEQVFRFVGNSLVASNPPPQDSLLDGLEIETSEGSLYIYWCCSHGPSSISPDGRYILVADVPTFYTSPPHSFQRMMFDREHDEVLFYVDSELEDPLFMTYVREGFIINTMESGPRVMYRYADESIVELPDIVNGTYFDILPNGNVLYSRVTGDSQTRVFRYSPHDNETQLLIEDVLSVHVVDIHFIRG